MRKREQQVGPKLTPIETCPFEVKSTRGANVFYLREIRSHQMTSLLACNTDVGFKWKIPDAGWGFLPFDYIYFKNTQGYFVIAFPRMAYWIRAELLHFIIESGKTSISEEMADELCAKKDRL